MNTRNLSPEERYELILECRRSGLTDHQWLEEHGIRKSTFYSWISAFRKEGYPNIPEPLRQNSRHKPQIQEVVKVNISPDPSYMDQNIPSPIGQVHSATLRLPTILKQSGHKGRSSAAFTHFAQKQNMRLKNTNIPQDMLEYIR